MAVLILHQSIYDFYGNIDDFIDNNNEDIDRLIEFIKSIGDNSDETAESIAIIIKNISNIVIKQDFRKKLNLIK